MKICYIILDKLKEIPEEAMYRIYTEEKLKFIMRQTDEIEDIRTLEETFGNLFLHTLKIRAKPLIIFEKEWILVIY